jgi:hypothetical protein
MASARAELEFAMREVTQARKIVARGKTKQITAADDIDQLKAVAFAWFETHRPAVIAGSDSSLVVEVDAAYKTILSATSRAAARSTYLAALKDAKTALADALTNSAVPIATPRPTVDVPPDFSSLAADAKMQDILVRRWHECQVCVVAGAPLAATVMMGGLLEALCVARANKMPDKAPLFKAKATPIDPKTKKPLTLSEWTLRHYLDVAHELGWLTRSAKDVGEVLRDFRNYIHPQKEYSHGVVVSGTDAAMFWEIAKSLSRQVLAS